jgi:hypothetical protein
MSMSDDQPDRPTIRCLMALPGLSPSVHPRAFIVVDAIEVAQWEGAGLQLCGVDPGDEQRFDEWRVQQRLAP